MSDFATRSIVSVLSLLLIKIQNAPISIKSCMTNIPSSTWRVLPPRTELLMIRRRRKSYAQ
eukprot:8882868-Pyramimonas_sp.AAC.1